MVLIPKNNPIKEAMEGKTIYTLPRTYLGYSGLAHPCKRFLWLGFRWCYMKEIQPRLQRIFERGDLEEARVISSLKRIGCEVYRYDEEGNKVELFGTVGEKQEEVFGLAKHIAGHTDGRVIGLPGCEKTEHLLEIKTMKAKKYNELVKSGGHEAAIKKVFPIYYGQMMSYMGKTGLTRAMFICTNKDTEERLYIRVHFDEDEFKHLESVGMDVLTSTIPPKRIGDVTWFECKWCDARDVCHNDAMPVKTCRSCTSGCIEDNAIWSCDKTNKNLSKEEQEKGCKVWNMIPEIKDMQMNVK